jgi:hypothetical protein
VNFTRSVTVKNGTTVTDTNSLSGELGVSAYGLSARLSRTFSHTVTVMNETDVTTTYSYKPEKHAVWTLWQLLERFSFVDDKGNLIEWAADAQERPKMSGIVRLVLPAPRLVLPAPSVVNRSPTMCPDAVEF